MAREFHMPPSVWRKMTIGELWVYMADARDAGTIKKFDEGREEEAKAVIAQLRREKAVFVARMLGEKEPDGIQAGRSVCRILPKGSQRSNRRR
jgi:hypothetical protein